MNVLISRKSKSGIYIYRISLRKKEQEFQEKLCRSLPCFSTYLGQTVRAVCVYCLSLNYSFLCILTHCVCVVVVVKCLMPNLLVFRATDFIYLLCNIGSKQGSKGGNVYTDLSGGTKRFPLFCLALLLAAIWLIMAAIFSSENFCYSDTQKSWQTTEVFLICSIIIWAFDI